MLEKNQKDLKYDEFEVIKKLGEGNFTEVFKVQYKKLGTNSRFYALKVCNIQKVTSMGR